MKEKEKFPIQETRRKIIHQLLGKDLTALDLEEMIGINESAVRKHLDVLEQNGYVDHYFEKAGRGRPNKLFRITKKGRQLLPQKTHLLFHLLAGRVKERYGDEEFRNILSEVAEEIAEKIAPKGDLSDFESRIENFVENLDDFGFYPSFSKEDDTYEVIYRNCVFEGVIDDFEGDLCKTHKDIVQDIFPNSEIILKESYHQNGNICRHKISKEV